MRGLVKSESGINIFGSGMAIFLDMMNETVFFLLFEDKGRLQAHGNGVKIWLLPGQSLSREQERDCRLTENKSRPRHS